MGHADADQTPRRLGGAGPPTVEGALNKSLHQFGGVGLGLVEEGPGD